MNKRKVLVVEDDPALMLGLSENLAYAGYDVARAADGDEGLRLALASKPDMVLLDVMLPRRDGYAVCRELRARGLGMPIIMLTARKDEVDKLLGFDAGADDYVTKPFSIKELLARVQAVLRRGDRQVDMAREYRFGDCVLDTETRTLTRAGRPVDLTRTEFDLLAYLCLHEGKALTRNVLLDEVWGVEYYGTQRSLDTFVAALRKKIEENPRRPRHILTLHGVGYRFAS